MTMTATPAAGDTLEERLLITMRRAKLTPPKMARRIGVTSQTVRNWLDPEHPARPRYSDLLSWAVATGHPVEFIDPDHPDAGLRVQNLKILRRGRDRTRPARSRPRTVAKPPALAVG